MAKYVDHETGKEHDKLCTQIKDSLTSQQFEKKLLKQNSHLA